MLSYVDNSNEQPTRAKHREGKRTEMLIPQLLLLLFFFCGLRLFAPTGHSTLLLYFRCRRCIRNPAPGRMRYSYIFIAVLREFYLPVGSGLQGLQQLWGRPAYNLLGVRPNPTVYSLYALNPPSPGFEPRTPQSTLAELHFRC